MANQVSTQVANQDAVPSVPNKTDTAGILKVVFFSGTISAALGLAIGTLIDLCDLPKGVRILRAVWGNDAVFSGAGVTLNIGWSGAAAALASGLDCASLNHTAMAGTLALNAGVVQTAARRVQATTIGDVIVATGTYYGWIEYI